MPADITYIEFHAVFVLPPLLILLYLVSRKMKEDKISDSYLIGGAGVGLLSVVALVYTTPWDNYLISKGVWEYGDGSVILRIWEAPLEEYIFILLQPIIAGSWIILVRDEKVEEAEKMKIGTSLRNRAVGIGLGLSVGVLGILLLTFGSTSTYYVGAILAWSGPVLALQWGFGPEYLWNIREKLAVCVLVPTLYLSTVDSISISLGVWKIAGEYTTGIEVFGLPVEEGLFFMVTNLFVAQGLLMFYWVVKRWRVTETDEVRRIISSHPRPMVEKSNRKKVSGVSESRDSERMVRKKEVRDGNRERN